MLEIPEYWIVDPLENRITIRQLNEGRYDETLVTGETTLPSLTFPELQLTVTQVLMAKR